MFNEKTSARKGFLQAIEPRVKIVTVLFFIVALSFQKSIMGIAAFSIAALLMLFLSGIPLEYFLRKILPAVTITLCIAAPAMLNVVVEGTPLFMLLSLGHPVSIGPVSIPKEISITEPGLRSATTLLMRVATSVTFVLLISMTTKPSRLMKAFSSLVPGSLSPIVSISYRYIFFLIRKTGQFIMGLKSRRISRIKAVDGRRWVSSRVGLLFSISLDLSRELEMAMKSRGYTEGKLEILSTKFEITGKDVAWVLFTIFFCGGAIWKSFL